MRRCDVPAGVEGEYEPGSHRRVLKNLLGIKKKEMDLAESTALEAIQKRYYSDPSLTITTRFDAALIRKMHKDWLGHIYEWAGKYRTVDVSKDDFVCPPACLIPQNMKRFEEETLLILTPCLPAPLRDVSEAIAKVHGELLLIHPFREGNGRLARWLAALMAVQAGYPPPLYRFYGRGSIKTWNEYLEAVKLAYWQNYTDLTRFFEEAILLRLDARE